MKDDIIKGIAVGLGLILLFVGAGFGVGSCYAGGDYSDVVPTPEERSSIDDDEVQHAAIEATREG